MQLYSKSARQRAVFAFDQQQKVLRLTGLIVEIQQNVRTGIGFTYQLPTGSFVIAGSGDQTMVDLLQTQRIQHSCES